MQLNTSYIFFCRREQEKEQKTEQGMLSGSVSYRKTFDFLKKKPKKTSIIYKLVQMFLFLPIQKPRVISETDVLTSAGLKPSVPRK